MFLAVVFCLLAACSSSEGKPKEHVEERTEEGVGESSDGSIEGDVEESMGGMLEESVEESTEKTSSSLFGDYFKEGNAMYRLVVFVEAPQDGGCMNIFILQRDKEYSHLVSVMREFRIIYEEDKAVYEVKDEMKEQDCRITFHEDGSIIVESEGTKAEELGAYYAFDANLLMADIFERPLCRADLIGLSKQDLRLLRNQFYAVYGRKFQDEGLREYFESKNWYQGLIESDDFDDEIFGRLEKSNIAFLQEAEDSFDEKQAEEEKKAYEGLADAPYLELLPKKGEVAVSLHKDEGNAKDMGIYYEVQGSISLPVVLTQDEYRMLHQGEKLEIVMDELTGETAELSKGDGLQSGYTISQADYRLEGDLVYDEELGGYRLWEGSDDTIFRKVYEGNIYVLKGAIDGYMGYFEMSEDEIPEGTSEYGEMTFTGDDSEETYWANRPAWDKKGYLKAMFFYGD